ncbi:MAG: choice-of-anchor Q domain-containing protein, partial [Mucilaginibacter sp.]
GSGTAVFKKSKDVKLTALNNYVNKDVTTCMFVNFNYDDFHLLSSSPLIDTGADVSPYGVSFDFYNTTRPSGSGFDIGATEYR